MLYENIIFDENTRIYVNLVSVSKSGMTRRAKFYVIVDNELQDITDIIAKTLGQNLDKNYCLTIRGGVGWICFSIHYIDLHQT